MQEDLYGALGVAFGATAQEISRAYRAKALALHPDKQHGSDAERARAAALFAVVQKAREVLLDTQARAAYDAVVRAQQQRLQRAQQMDAQRQAMAARLERRDTAAGGAGDRDLAREERAARERLEAEIRRLRAAGRLHPSAPTPASKRERADEAPSGAAAAKTPRHATPTRIIDNFDDFEAAVLARAARCADTDPIVIT